MQFIATGIRKAFVLGRTPFCDLPQGPEFMHVLDVLGPSQGILRSFGALMINKPHLANSKWGVKAARTIRMEGVERIVVDGEVFSALPGDVLELRVDEPVTFVTP